MIRTLALIVTLLLTEPVARAQDAVATFAGGCFWCTESDFEKLAGVKSAVSGYIGGQEPNPGYAQVSAGASGHAEAVQLRFDPAVISYERLLQIYWHSVDPYRVDAQFCDRGRQYRTAIFVHGAAQRAAAERSLAELRRLHPERPPIVTEIVDAGRFWPAEDYHQDYYRKNPLRYRYYRSGCGRDARLEQLWGKDRIRQ